MMFTNEAPSIDLSVAERLAALRIEMEGGDEPICEIEVPAALLLDDVCSALELPTHERVWVLGDGVLEKREGNGYSTRRKHKRTTTWSEAAVRPIAENQCPPLTLF